ncbi:GNAT family N-acetyltransferase [Kitasatospora sp. NPDC058965]|uniref:GNAT family N-acetyltransferase n=1 Tax=Kitasatospora sp. NPDC058965 TaxID=3346682 RepID=UPI0036B3BF13
MTLEIRPLVPQRATEALLDEYHLMRAAAAAVDFAEDPPLTRDGAVGRLLVPLPEDGACTFWTGHLDGRLAGSVKLGLPDGANSGIASVEVWVHPELRRRGVGSALLRTVLPAVRAAGRGTVIGLPVKPEAPGAPWAAGFGFEVTHSVAIQTLAPAATPAQLWQLPDPAGYRLVQWAGATPEDLVESYATARRAIQDAPWGDSSFQQTPWTPELVRAADRELAQAGTEQWASIAVAQATGEVVGVHGLYCFSHRREYGYVHETSVLAAHRGHGLGRAIKAALMRRLAERRPDLQRIATSTDTTNTHMIRINLALGYRTARTMNWLEVPTAELAARLE